MTRSLAGRGRPGVWLLGVVAVAGFFAAEARAQEPGAEEPLEVARAFAERYPESTSMGYVPALTWSATLELAELTGEDRWRRKVEREIEPYLSGERSPLEQPHLLMNVAGNFVFHDAARLAGVPEAAALGREAAELVLPRSDDEPIRFGFGWTDDMFMAAALLAREADASGEDRFGRVVGEVLVSYAEALQRPDGLFVHAEDGPHPWGRGNGFAALGLAEALALLPEDWSDRPRVLEIYRQQMEALAAHQGEDGSWRQVLDEPTSYRELTVTATTVAAMARGVRMGWLPDEAFGPVVDAGWEAIAERVGDDGTVRDASDSTPAGETLEHYLERPVVDGVDDRAGALVLLAAVEVAKLWDLPAVSTP